MENKIEIETERLLIRSYIEADATALFSLVEANKNHIADSMPYTLSQNTSAVKSGDYILETLAELQSGKKIALGIFLRSELIGQAILKSFDWKLPKCELGYFIHHAQQRNGFATETVAALVQYGSKELKLVKLFARIEASNLASKHVVEKNGFTLKGMMEKDFRTASGKLVDVEYYEFVY